MTKRLRAFLHNPLVIIVPIVLAGLWGWHYYIDKVHAAPDGTAYNLLPSGAFDDKPLDGLPSGWSLQTSDAPVRITRTDEGYRSSSALEVTVTSYTRGSVDLQSPRLAAVGGADYLSKGYYRSTVPLDVLVREELADGTTKLRFLRRYEASDAWSTVSIALTVAPQVEHMQLMYRLAAKGSLTLDGIYVERNDAVDRFIPMTFDSRQPLATNDDAATVSGGGYLGFAVTYRADAPSRLIADYTLADGTQQSSSLVGLGAAREATYVEVYATAPMTAHSVSLRMALQGEEGMLQIATQAVYDITDKAKRPFVEPMVSLAIVGGRKATSMIAPQLLAWSHYPASFYIDPDTIGHDGYADKQDVQIMLTGNNQAALYEADDISLLNARTLERKLALQRGYFREEWNIGPLDMYAPSDQADVGVRQRAVASFTSRLSNQQGINNAQNFDAHALRVVRVDKTMTPGRLKGLIEETRQQRGWLILLYSGVEEGWNPAVSPATFSEQLTVLKRGKIPVLTVQNALTAIVSR